ncbi:MAG: hypothetical protein WA584_08980 [Pyrinomonadaceae bacterium]
MSRLPTIKLSKDTEKSFNLLVKNYRLIDNLYRRGLFEIKLNIDESGLINEVKPQSDSDIPQININDTLTKASNYKIKYEGRDTLLSELVEVSVINYDDKISPFLAASFLIYIQALEIEKKLLHNINNHSINYWDLSSTEITKNPIRLINRTHILAYEISDYFLATPHNLAYWFHNTANDIMNLSDINKFIKAKYSLVPDKTLMSELTKDCSLIVLFAANDFYRRHNADSYENARQLLKFLKEKVIDLKTKDNKGMLRNLALSGLFYYIKGRVDFARSNFKESAQDFRKSTEFYLLKLTQDELKYQKEIIKPDEFRNSKILSMRRIALTSILGSGFQALVESRVSEALQLAMLAKSVLVTNSGIVYKTYAELIYQSARRAYHSSDSNIIFDVINKINECRNIFINLVPKSHYIHRAGIELSLALHYLARAMDQGNDNILKMQVTSLIKQQLENFPDLAAECEGKSIREKIYSAALRYLEEAIKFTENKNNRLKCETLTISSHLLRLKSNPNLTESLKNAEKSMEFSEGMGQIFCEAKIAVGAVLAALIDKKRSTEKNKRANTSARADYTKACLQFEEVLRINNGANHRISAVAYLQLAECYLKMDRISLARHFFQQWEKIKGHVEHEYVHQKASEIQQRLNITDHVFTVDLQFQKDVNYWREEFNKWYFMQKIIELSKVITNNPDDFIEGTKLTGKQYIELLKKDNEAPRLRPPLVRIAMDIFGVKNSAAYDKLKEFEALKKLERIVSEISLEKLLP